MCVQLPHILFFNIHYTQKSAHTHTYIYFHNNEFLNESSIIITSIYYPFLAATDRTFLPKVSTMSQKPKSKYMPQKKKKNPYCCEGDLRLERLLGKRRSECHRLPRGRCFNRSGESPRAAHSCFSCSCSLSSRA